MPGVARVGRRRDACIGSSPYGRLQIASPQSRHIGVALIEGSAVAHASRESVMQHLEALVGSGLRTEYAVRRGATGADHTGVEGAARSLVPWATKKPARGGLGVVVVGLARTAFLRRGRGCSLSAAGFP